jgi:hypothetical protein
MKIRSLLIIFATSIASGALAQNTFKAGFKTYNTVMIIHEYSYNYTHTDSARINPIDSAKTFVTTDSMVTMTETFRNRESAFYKSVNYFSPKKQLVKTEEYKDEALQEVNEWRYDDKNRKTMHYRDNRVNGSNYRKQYDYAIDKKTGETVVTESSFYNNKIEFYTKMYYDSKNVMYKEVRMNDNNKDIIHVETFTYGDNGKVKERSVYFPEFKVTKKFPEPAGNVPLKCFAIMPVGTVEKVNPATRNAYIKRVIQRNILKLNDAECKDYEYTFTNNVNCAISIATSKNSKIVRYRYKEKV